LFGVLRKGSLGILVAFASLLALHQSRAIERWPKLRIDPAWLAELHETYDGTSGYFHDESYSAYLQEYTRAGDYLNYGKNRKFVNDGEIVIARDGLPKARVGNVVYDNPVTLSQFALATYGRHLNKAPGALGMFTTTVEKLISMQAGNGGLPYAVDLPYRDQVLKRGWISAMAQGQALSVFARALHMDPGHHRYREAGDKAFKNLMTPVSKGGGLTDLGDLDPSLSGFPYFAEYPLKPNSFTLNGFMFTLLGLYDWSQFDPDAAAAFESGLLTLERVLPYHDLEGYSTYDLVHMVENQKPYVPMPYEGIHVYLLHALNSVSPRPIMLAYENKWRAKIDQMNALLKIVTIGQSRTSPQSASVPIIFTVATAGGPAAAKRLYRLGIKSGNEWTLQEWSEDPVLRWVPSKPGNYVIGLYAKAAGSPEKWDSFRHLPFLINPVMAASGSMNASAN
jgi:heparosan-N-sulfate-glucuronate 5-epimerase